MKNAEKLFMSLHSFFICVNFFDFIQKKRSILLPGKFVFLLILLFTSKIALFTTNFSRFTANSF